MPTIQISQWQLRKSQSNISKIEKYYSQELYESVVKRSNYFLILENFFNLLRSFIKSEDFNNDLKTMLFITQFFKNCVLRVGRLGINWVNETYFQNLRSTNFDNLYANLGLLQLNLKKFQFYNYFNSLHLLLFTFFANLKVKTTNGGIS